MEEKKELTLNLDNCCIHLFIFNYSKIVCFKTKLIFVDLKLKIVHVFALFLTPKAIFTKHIFTKM